jgi:hypothetical protein
MRLLRHLLLSLLMITGGLVATAAPANAGTYGPYEIILEGWPKCLYGIGTDNSTAAAIRTCAIPSTTRYHFDFIDTTNGYYRIKNRKSGKCLNVQGGSMSMNARVIQYTCGGSGTLNDQWVPDFNARVNGLDYYLLMNRKSHLCLRAPSADDGTQLVQYDCYDRLNMNSFTWKRPPGV